MPESLFEWTSFNYAILSMRKVKFKIIWDTDMYLFFEKGMRCGVSYISMSYSIQH